MEGNNSGFEKTSFSEDHKIFSYYHSKKQVEQILINNNFSIVKYFELNYEEMDGKITKDLVYILLNT